MRYTAADLIASAFAKPPTHIQPCPFSFCSWTSSVYYNPGDARGARNLHVNFSHNVETHSRREENDVEYTLDKQAARRPGTSPRGYRRT